MSVPADAALWPDGQEPEGNCWQGEQPPAGETAVGQQAFDEPAFDEEAFTAMFQEHYPACVRLARRLVRDEGLAHEVVQEVFLAWWRTTGGGYRADRGRLAAWLSTLTHHKAVDAVRTAERHRRLLTAAASALPAASQQRFVDEVVWWKLGRQSLAAALPTLTPTQREVLDLAYGHGLTQAQIAERLSIPLGTVKSRTHAGMLRLRAAIGGNWTPTGPTGPTSRPERTTTCSPRPTKQDRHERGSQPETATAATVGVGTVRAGTLRADVDRCATALVSLAAAEDTDSLDSTLMIGEAAALVDRHGDAGMYGLVVALARMAAVGAASRQTQLSPVRHRHRADQSDAAEGPVKER